MRSASRNPRVMKSTVRSPLRSSSALVATVVPIFTASMRSTGMGASPATPRISRMPASAASAYRSGFSDSSLCVTSAPSGRRATTSVNVPPRSIQNCQRSGKALPQLRDRAHRKPDASRIERRALRGELGDHDLVRAVDEQILPVDAQAEDERRFALQYIPLIPVAHRQTREVLRQVARAPRRRIAILNAREKVTLG